MNIPIKKVEQIFAWMAALFIVAVSGVPIVYEHTSREFVWPIAVCVLGSIWIWRGCRFSRNGVLILLVFLFAVIVHAFAYWGMGARASLGFLFMLTTTFLAVNIATNFVEKYISIMVVLAAVSLCFFVPQQLGLVSASMFSGLPGAALENGNVHAWIYNFHWLHIGRNSGPFWEPGAFAGYLVVALTLSMFTEHKTSNRSLIILMLALITTYSTTGFVAAMPVVYLWLSRRFKHVKVDLKLAGMLGSVFVAIVVFGIMMQEIPFLVDKIQSQYEKTSKRSEQYEKLRFGAAVYDWDFIVKRPIIGWTPDEAPREKIDPSFPEIYQDTGNGFTGFAAKFGVLALFFYLWRVYATSREHGLKISESWVVVITFVAMLQGEQFLNWPIFWAIMMMPPRRTEIQAVLSSVARSAAAPMGRGGIAAPS